ncbi:MAG: SPOR domain-containing protein [bacterium]
MFILLFLPLILAQPLMAQTVLELIQGGRLVQARQRVEGVDSLMRYQDYLAAMTEVDAVRACSLYQVISWRYPETDVDHLAQERLLAYQAWGRSLPPFVAPGWSLKAEVPETLKEVSTSQEVVAAVPSPAPPEPEPSPTPTIEKQEIAQPPEPAKEPPKPTVERQEPVPSPEPSKEPPKEMPKPIAPEPSVRPITEPPKIPHDVGVKEAVGIWVQVGAFRVKQNAEKLAGKLRAAGFSVEIFSKQSTKTLLHHVRVGAYPSREAAQEAGEELKEDFGLEFRIIKI